MPTTKSKKRAASGRLRIGDQWNAINIIAHSQTHPLKAICELVENAIDAGSRNVHIYRRRRQGNHHLEVVDDGKGLALNDDGEPDFAYIATHICDSMKRRLENRERDGVHGEFGIGLLSFWSLGEELRMASASKEGRLREISLKRGKREYTVRNLRDRMPTFGVKVVVGPLLEATRNVVTGEKLQRYLSSELRDRIRNTGVKIRITDRISRKDLMVAPRDFEGEPLREARSAHTPFGPLNFELYLRATDSSRDAAVAVCKDGTRVLTRITDLEQFQHAPWTDGRLEGVLDFRAINLAPGTRSGIVPDERLEAFVAAVQSLEPTISAAIHSLAQAETDKASRQILKQLHKAFVSALRELPQNEYLFFDLPEPGSSVGRGGSANGQADRRESGLPVSARDQQAADQVENEAEKLTLSFEPGPLASVVIKPRRPRVRPGGECTLTATALDENGVALIDGVQFQWRIAEGDASLHDAGERQCRLKAAAAGVANVQVTATQGEARAEDTVSVKVVENLAGDDDSNKGLPSYRLQAEHGKPRRSRYDAAKNEIVINSSHRDFLASRSTGAKHRRYVGKLYAKEVVLLNFPHESAGEAMERLIEMLVHTEDVL